MRRGVWPDRWLRPVVLALLGILAGACFSLLYFPQGSAYADWLPYSIGGRRTMRGTPGGEPVCTVRVTPGPGGEADTLTYTLTSYRSMLSASPGGKRRTSA